MDNVGFNFSKETYQFPLDEAWEFGSDTTKKIRETIHGGCGLANDDGAVLAQAVKNAGDGDYLELGTFYGASGILASLTKKKYGIEGEVCCVDDLSGVRERTPADIMNNAEMMNASIVLNVSKTSPLPFYNRKFNCVFIDASHDIQNVFEDWLSVRKVSTKYIVFHDYASAYPGVMAVVRLADFYPVHISAHMAVLENPRWL